MIKIYINNKNTCVQQKDFFFVGVGDNIPEFQLYHRHLLFVENWKDMGGFEVHSGEMTQLRIMHDTCWKSGLSHRNRHLALY